MLLQLQEQQQLGAEPSRIELSTETLRALRASQGTQGLKFPREAQKRHAQWTPLNPPFASEYWLVFLVGFKGSLSLMEVFEIGPGDLSEWRDFITPDGFERLSRRFSFGTRSLTWV